MIAKKTNKSAKEVKPAAAKVAIDPQLLVHQLHRDVSNSILVVSVLVNLFVLIGWLVIQVSNRYDAALINYLQNK